MLPRYRVQVRRQIGSAPGSPGFEYVFRDMELPFVPLPGLEVEDFDGERFRIGQEVVWYEGQHRFVAYADAPADAPAAPVEEAITEQEARGWQRNRRAAERVAA